MVRGGSLGWTPMRPAVVKSLSFLSSRSRPPSRPPSRPSLKSGVRADGRGAGADNYLPAPAAPDDPTVSWRLPARRSGMAPTLLLSVSVRCTEHQRLIGEAWERAPLLELGVTRCTRPVVGRSHQLVVACARPPPRAVSPPAVSAAHRREPARSRDNARGRLPVCARAR
jgi:hypothetical protein